MFMWYCIIWGRRSFRNTAGLSLENKLQSVMRCRAVCSAFSGQLHSGVGAFLGLNGSRSDINHLINTHFLTIHFPHAGVIRV